MKVFYLLLLGIISVLWSISLHRNHLITIAAPSHNFPDEPLYQSNGDLLRSVSTTKPLDSSKNASDSIAIETVLIIATAPYTADHVMALWTHLECVTTGIDKVLISAPDTPWSREIIAEVVKKFNQLLRESHKKNLNVDAAFYTNNRYDVGLWCDGLREHLGFDGHHFPDNHGTSTPPRAIFLINDSTVALRLYSSLTERIVKSSQIEQQNQKMGTPMLAYNVKIVSLNGNLVQPGITKYYWVESVYRGLTPSAISTFYQHSCTAEAGRACVGKTGDSKKKCIVNRYEMSLADAFAPSEVDAMYPTYLPKEWDASKWIESGGAIGPIDQWIRGRRFFRYLHQVHDFPFRKLKWPEKGQPPPPKSQCLVLIYSESWFKKLPFPSDKAYKAFRAEMLKSESTL